MSLPGISSRLPSKLCPCIREKHAALLEQADFPVKTIETSRDLERQRYYVSIGASQTLRSYHLPQRPNFLALAFDVAPEAYLPLKGWNPKGSLWERMGRLGESLGLTWGGRWRGFVDKAHFQLDRCICTPPETP